MEQFLLKFLRFSLVGLSGMILDFGITYLCKEKLKWQKYLSNTTGFLTAVCSNYVLNRYWTFDSRNPDIGGEFASFVFVSIIGLAINNVVLWFTHQRFKIPFYQAKVIAIGITVLWNFFSNLLFTFKDSINFYK